MTSDLISILNARPAAWAAAWFFVEREATT